MPTPTATKTKSARAEALDRIVSREQLEVERERQEVEVRAHNAELRQARIAEAQANASEAVAAREVLISDLLEHLPTVLADCAELIDCRTQYDAVRSLALKWDFDVAPWPRLLGVVRGGKVQSDGSTAPLVGREERALLDTVIAALQSVRVSV